MRISGRLSLERLMLFVGLVARLSYADDCSYSAVYVQNFITVAPSDNYGWSAPYVGMGVDNNDSPYVPPDAKGLNLNLGTSGDRLYMGAQLVRVCLDSAIQVVSNISISSNPDCSTLGSGWVAEVGHLNLNQGVAGAPGLWMCLKYGLASDKNVFGAYFKLGSYTPVAGYAYSADLNSGLGKDPISLFHVYNDCGGKCQNGGICYQGACHCPSGFTGARCDPIMSITVTKPSACGFNFSTIGGTGPYKYSINNGPKSSNTGYKVTSSGTYTVTSYDVNGYSTTTTVSTPVPVVSALTSPSSWSTTPNLYTTSAGSDDAAFSVSGVGKAPFVYFLTPSGTAYSYSSGNEGQFQNIAAGSYLLNAIDADGCKSTSPTVTVVAQTVASPPTGISAFISSANNAPFATVSWVAPSSTGYTNIVGYLVSWGYKSSTGSTVWTVNQTITSGLNSTTSDTTASTSTLRYVKIATINSVGTGAFSSTVSFQGLCAAGFYNTTGSTCTPCSAGYNTLGLIGKSVCRACAAGTYSAAGSPTCTSCTGNTYAKSASSTCTACAPGSVSVSQQYCQSCAPGSYASAGSTTCSQCPENTYAADAGSSSCSPCPAGLTSQPGSGSCTDSTGYKK